ncbi:MAG: hypothetical protein AAGF88_04475 [Pseudomonadota bacterium]
MNDQYDTFQERVGRINRTHKRKVPYTFTVRPDGLMVPRTRSRLRFYFPWRAILAGFFVVVAVKAFMIYYLTPPGYETRMTEVLTGSAYAEAAATILAPDPVSLWVASQIGGLVAWASDPEI